MELREGFFLTDDIIACLCADGNDLMERRKMVMYKREMTSVGVMSLSSNR